MGKDDMPLHPPVRAARARAHRSDLSEHFRGDLPLFVNRWEEGFDLREHDHAYVEIAYVMSGEGYHYVSGAASRTGKGRLYILPVGTTHIFRPVGATGSSRLLVYNLGIKPDWLPELKRWLSRHGGGASLRIFEGEPGTHIALADKDMTLGRTIERLHREYTDGVPGFETVLIAGLLELSVRICRLAESDPAAHGIARDAARGTPEMSGLLTFVDAHASEPLTVRELAARAGLSARHMIRLFRRHAGMGFSEYVQHKRVEQSCRLLLDTERKIADIAKSAGYRDPAHFREVFRKVMGVSPGQYRRAGRHLEPE
ncbi:AraC family transcriptional regulator [Cohnella sp. JJ-181]|uniref:AraC family transcriptional regulator n=1 Tax=Cohnella rhizoplanae TaxID=2974897 RepID=UPI0022FF582A|nr:AraC family transcriptional regulator [Cohnella sp. JJ-181]CAI6043813.1 HTH-type transcriptional activator RhaR [Cohnella sp. JJ-181]